MKRSAIIAAGILAGTALVTINALSSKDREAKGHRVTTSEGSSKRTDSKIKISGSQFSDEMNGFGGVLPNGWKISRVLSPSPEETSLSFQTRDLSGAQFSAYYAKRPGNFSAEQLWQKLIQGRDYKLRQRKKEYGDAYTIVTEKMGARHKGLPSLTWSARFEKDRVEWKEHVMRLEADGYSFLVFLATPISNEEVALQAYFEFLDKAKFPGGSL